MARGLRQKSKVIDEARPLNSEIVEKAMAELEEIPVVEKVGEIKTVPADTIKTGYVTKLLNVRKEPSISSVVLTILSPRTTVQIVDEQNGFGKLADRDGWVMLAFISF